MGTLSSPEPVAGVKRRAFLPGRASTPPTLSHSPRTGVIRACVPRFGEYATARRHPQQILAGVLILIVLRPTVRAEGHEVRGVKVHELRAGRAPLRAVGSIYLHDLRQALAHIRQQVPGGTQALVVVHAVSGGGGF